MDYNGSENTEELSFLLRSTFMIRRLKKEVLKDLPEKQRTQIHIDAGGSQASQIKALKAQLESDSNVKLSSLMNLINFDGDSMADRSISDKTFTSLNKMYSLTAEAKIDSVVKFI